MQCSFTEEFTYDDGSKSTIVCLNQAEILYTKSPHYGLCYKCGFKKLQVENERLKAKVENQRRRIVYLEGATNHATGTPLSEALEENKQLKELIQEGFNAWCGDVSWKDYLKWKWAIKVEQDLKGTE